MDALSAPLTEAFNMAWEVLWPLILVWRFLRTGGLAMLRMMDAPEHASGSR